MLKNITTICILTISLSSCSQSAKSDFILEEPIEQELCELVWYLDTSGFVGNFGFDMKDTSLVFGHSNKELQIPGKYVELLKRNFAGGVERGVVNNKDYTYFIIDGYFRKGNYGVIFSKANYFDRKDDVIFCKLIRKSACNEGNWFFVETNL